MRASKDVYAPLIGHEDDPRIARDLVEIVRQVERLAEMDQYPGVYRDYRYRRRAAGRVIEQRVDRALRKLERTRIAA